MRVRVMSRKEWAKVPRGYLIGTSFEDRDVIDLETEAEEIITALELEDSVECVVVNDNHTFDDLGKQYDPFYSYYLVRKEYLPPTA